MRTAKQQASGLPEYIEAYMVLMLLVQSIALHANHS
jgi:hypothetical protein